MVYYWEQWKQEQWKTRRMEQWKQRYKETMEQGYKGTRISDILSDIKWFHIFSDRLGPRMIMFLFRAMVIDFALAQSSTQCIMQIVHSYRV